MNNSITITETKLVYDEYYNAYNVSIETQKKLGSVDVLAVPGKYNESTYLFGQETIDFIKYCRQHDDEHTYDILADKVDVLSLHSFDIWLPILFISESIVIPFAINMISNYIWEKRKGREHEDAKVDVTLILEKDGTKKTVHYHGDAAKFSDTFKDFRIN